MDPSGPPVIASYHVLTDEPIFRICYRLLTNHLLTFAEAIENSFRLFLVTPYEFSNNTNLAINNSWEMQL